MGGGEEFVRGAMGADCDGWDGGGAHLFFGFGFVLRNAEEIGMGYFRSS